MVGEYYRTASHGSKTCNAFLVSVSLSSCYFEGFYVRLSKSCAVAPEFDHIGVCSWQVSDVGSLLLRQKVIKKKS